MSSRFQTGWAFDLRQCASGGLKRSEATASCSSILQRGNMQTSTDKLIDTFGRVHDNLRISVTDRCNIRCFYCMPETGVKFVKREEILDFEEIERFVRIAAGLGVRKLRITGGEPLLRRDLPVLVARLSAIEGI